MDLHRLSVKYFLGESSKLKLEEIVPVFHRWIQERAVEGFLIDVADYRHLGHGPGVVLIGHDVDYALDMSEGRPGLLHRQKSRGAGGLRERLRPVFRAALLGCRALEAEPSLGGRLRFRTDEAELVFPDRLRVPNAGETFERLRGEIEPFLSRLYAGLKVGLAPSGSDPRECFGVRISAPGAPGLASLLERLDAS